MQTKYTDLNHWPFSFFLVFGFLKIYCWKILMRRGRQRKFIKTLPSVKCVIAGMKHTHEKRRAWAVHCPPISFPASRISFLFSLRSFLGGRVRRFCSQGIPLYCFGILSLHDHKLLLAPSCQQHSFRASFLAVSTRELDVSWPQWFFVVACILDPNRHN